tara:strand:- start:257 stop:976 length:720 start_codon:yes stop_codon:yes gene_type:complete
MMALQAAEQPTAKEIWETLSKIDVSEHIERKGGLSYLSWAWAWGVLKDHYPQADYEFREWTVDIVPVSHVGPTIDCMIYADGSASVHCQVTIVDVAASMWLPVMDYKNKAISNPDARAISDSKMRCLVKCIAMLGLGHYIYAGEDLPGNSGESDEPKKKTAAKPVKQKPEATETTPLDDEGQSGVALAYRVFVQDCDTLDDLKLFWKKNQSELKKLEGSHPDLYKEIFNLFSNKKKELV